MQVKYFFISDELLKKEKKDTLIEYTRTVLNNSDIKKSEKKEVFFKYILNTSHKLKQEDFQKLIDFFDWNINSTDIFQDVSLPDIIQALETIDTQINYLLYKRNQKDKTPQEKMATRNIRCHLFFIRDRALKKLVLLKKCKIDCICTFEKERETIFLTNINNKDYYFKVKKHERAYQLWAQNKKIKHDKYVVPNYPVIKKGVSLQELNKSLAILKAVDKVHNNSL